ncbi:hypothetical protein LTS18_004951 [Coniosporium uncinatum]|uniref:Uncharacterized protein n=1 Tax=Coniosporium uncinatum TaxID=93489 RepID=A0ACC3DSA0_9PEZI|nr:hypothetical protein LTS18_004951 [Coniosporium uncinatum]
MPIPGEWTDESVVHPFTDAETRHPSDELTTPDTCAELYPPQAPRNTIFPTQEEASSISQPNLPTSIPQPSFHPALGLRFNSAISDIGTSNIHTYLPTEPWSPLTNDLIVVDDEDLQTMIHSASAALYNRRRGRRIMLPQATDVQDQKLPSSAPAPAAAAATSLRARKAPPGPGVVAQPTGDISSEPTGSKAARSPQGYSKAKQAKDDASVEAFYDLSRPVRANDTLQTAHYRTSSSPIPAATKLQERGIRTCDAVSEVVCLPELMSHIDTSMLERLCAKDLNENTNGRSPNAPNVMMDERRRGGDEKGNHSVASSDGNGEVRPTDEMSRKGRLSVIENLRSLFRAKRGKIRDASGKRSEK